MQASALETAELYQEEVGRLREGHLWSKMLLHGDENTLDNYRLDISRALEEWTTPRHRHTFDQIRYQLEGDLEYAKDKYLKPGWVGYFPEGVYYGPQVRPVGCSILLLQFGSCGRGGYMSKAQRKRGFEELAEKGKFEKGIYTWLDDKGQRHNKEGYEAIYEHVMGRKADYSKPRYNELITMNPAHYEWVPGDQPGVEYKWLGTFTEREFKMGFIRVDAGATLQVGREQAREVLYLSSGTVAVDGVDYIVKSSFGTKPGEPPAAIKAKQASEFFYVRLPRF